MDLDYMLEPEEKDDIVGFCCMCGEELHSIDDIIKYNGDLYCSCDCVLPELGGTDVEIIEDDNCAFCGEDLLIGDDAVEDINGSIFCGQGCLLAGHDIEEVYGYDL